MEIPPEAFLLDRQAAVPLQLQLRRQVIKAVLSGRFRAGEKMPSVRVLARHLGVARVTVAQAFAELVATDYLTSRYRSGHYVSDGMSVRPAHQQLPRQPGFDWNTHLDGRFAACQRRDLVQDWRRYRYSFVYGQPDPQLVDHAAWRDCAVRALGRREFAPLTGDLYNEDDPELIGYIARHILPRRGIEAAPDQILLTMGAQNALWLIAQVLLGPGRRCAIEDPCYPGLREILHHSGASVLPVAVDGEGLPPDEIPSGVSAVFTTASHQCPTNTTMPLARRKALIERAIADRFALIEDDYEFELAFGQATSPALKAMDRAGAVIYVGSFSKSVFPGLRLGYVVADPRFIAEARALRGMVLRHPPGHMQRTLAYFLSLGHHDAQMRRMRRTFAERRAVMLAAMTDQGLEHGRATGGSSFWLRSSVSSRELAQMLRGQDVLIEPGWPFFADPVQGDAFFRVAYSSIPADRIAEGIRRVAAAIRG